VGRAVRFEDGPPTCPGSGHDWKPQEWAYEYGKELADVRDDLGQLHRDRLADRADPQWSRRGCTEEITVTPTGKARLHSWTGRRAERG
jgi:hypothetical protein